MHFFTLFPLGQGNEIYIKKSRKYWKCFPAARHIFLRLWAALRQFHNHSNVALSENRDDIRDTCCVGIQSILVTSCILLTIDWKWRKLERTFFFLEYQQMHWNYLCQSWVHTLSVSYPSCWKVARKLLRACKSKITK